MQDIDKEIERERVSEQSQTQRVCFEVRAHLLYIPAFDTRRISTMLDPNGSRLGAATPMLTLKKDKILIGPNDV